MERDVSGALTPVSGLQQADGELVLQAATFNESQLEESALGHELYNEAEHRNLLLRRAFSVITNLQVTLTMFFLECWGMLLLYTYFEGIQSKDMKMQQAGKITLPLTDAPGIGHSQVDVIDLLREVSSSEELSQTAILGPAAKDTSARVLGAKPPSLDFINTATTYEEALLQAAEHRNNLLWRSYEVITQLQVRPHSCSGQLHN